MPAAAAVIGQAAGLSVAVPVVVRETVAQRRTHEVGLKVRVQLLLHPLLGRQRSVVLLALSEISDPAGEVVVVGLDRRAALGDTGEARPAGSRPARLP